MHRLTRNTLMLQCYIEIVVVEILRLLYGDWATKELALQKMKMCHG